MLCRVDKQRRRSSPAWVFQCFASPKPSTAALAGFQPRFFPLAERQSESSEQDFPLSTRIKLLIFPLVFFLFSPFTPHEADSLRRHSFVRAAEPSQSQRLNPLPRVKKAQKEAKKGKKTSIQSSAHPL